MCGAFSRQGTAQLAFLHGNQRATDYINVVKWGQNIGLGERCFRLRPEELDLRRNARSLDYRLGIRKPLMTQSDQQGLPPAAPICGSLCQHVPALPQAGRLWPPFSQRDWGQQDAPSDDQAIWLLTESRLVQSTLRSFPVQGRRSSSMTRPTACDTRAFPRLENWRRRRLDWRPTLPSMFTNWRSRTHYRVAWKPAKRIHVSNWRAVAPTGKARNAGSYKTEAGMDPPPNTKTRAHVGSGQGRHASAAHERELSAGEE